jgi:GTP-binding protein HflX
MADIIEIGLGPRGLEAERAVLVGTDRLVGEGRRAMRELADLARAAGVMPVEVLVQHREQPHQNTYLGKGKLQELKALMLESGATVALFAGNLSPRQVRNLVDVLEGSKVLDRTELILDIFAQHARTAEGKLQVELAQLSYLLPRLSGRGRMLDRIGGGAAGGVGVRGPGETKLETDRRRLRHRISRLEAELEEVRKRREMERQQRRLGGLGVVSLVGYTNAGKSTLLNALAGSAEVRTHDRLFETLDPTCRLIALGERELLVTDTVGFIHDLPKALVTAFRATLEEVLEADLLVHVVDAGNEFAAAEKRYTEDTLQQLGAEHKPVLLALNKWDLVNDERRAEITSQVPEGVPLAALTGEGLAEFKERLAAAFAQQQVPLRLVLPYERLGVLGQVRAQGEVVSESYEEGRVVAEVLVDEQIVEQLRQYTEPVVPADEAEGADKHEFEP